MPVPEYPELKAEGHVDTYHGQKVADPYRFLEDESNPKTQKWIESENALTEKYLNAIPMRADLKKKFTNLLDYTRFSTPVRIGNKLIYFANSGLQGQPVLYIRDNLKSQPRVLLDPNTLSENGTTSISGVEPSFNNKYLAYTQSEKGSDWNEIRIIDLKSGKPLDDVLKNVKFSTIAWKANGFYYCAYDNSQGKTDDFQKVYYHKVGSPQKNDKLIYQDKDEPNHIFSPWISESGELFLFVSVNGKTGYQVKYYENKKWKDLIPTFDYVNLPITYLNNELYILQEGKAFIYDPKTGKRRPFLSDIKTNIESVDYVGGKFFVNTLQDAYSVVYVYNKNGKLDHEITLPEYGTASGFTGRQKDRDTFYTFSSLTQAPTVYRYRIKGQNSEPYLESNPKINFKAFKTVQVFFNSKDGVKVPMFITCKRDLKLDGKNPTLMTGYGGFNYSYTPSFTPSIYPMLEKGGVHVLVNLRGGAEYGSEWHKQGMKHSKQNVFNDFIAAAEKLISLKYTTPDYLGMTGGSNGGLLVGAVMTQRPDLFAVAIPRMGVLDMLRFQNFTIGWAWTGEYGSSKDKDEFQTLLAYSPLHNLKKGVSYPATLITTADHDNRVVPMHSYKFAATLQALGKNDRPYLLRVYKNTGHGMGRAVSQSIEEMSDLYSFFLCNVKH
ncbi:MAG: prolyl oligopeptidase family serine peptidase [Simkaniaceae bacterium]|nr:prolyl oligopeptidase family serine peptidase [Simkaniaceae bacterium]